MWVKNLNGKDAIGGLSIDQVHTGDGKLEIELFMTGNVVVRSKDEQVSATTGTRREPRRRSAARIRRVASKPSISGIWQSMRTRSKRSRAQASTAGAPLATVVHSQPSRRRNRLATS